jgi:hypothetical protein
MITNSAVRDRIDKNLEKEIIEKLKGIGLTTVDAFWLLAESATDQIDARNRVVAQKNNAMDLLKGARLDILNILDRINTFLIESNESGK